VLEAFPRRVLAFSLPAYAVLFAIHLANSLHPLLHGRVPPDLGYAAAASTRLQFLQIAAIAYLSVVYAWALCTWRRRAVRARDLVLVIATLTLAAWTLLPANSSDVLEYLGFGRLAAVYGLNPYAHTYADITDWFSSYVTWDDPMPYGPPVLPLFALASAISAHQVLPGIYVLKFAWAAMHLVNAWLVYRLALSLTDDAALATFAFACNPLILIELVGNGHNDAVLLMTGLLAMLAAQRERHALAMVLAFVGAVVKLAGIVWVAGVVALLLRRRQWRALVWGSLACGAIALAVGLWPGCLDALTVLNSQWHYSEDSLHTLVIEGIVTIWAHVSRAASYDVVFDLDRLAATAAFAVFLVWRLRRIRDVSGLVRESGVVFLVLLLGFAASIAPWYLTWLLPMAVLTDAARVRHTILLACTTVIALYAFPFAMVETARHHELWAAVRLMLALGVPLAFGATYPIWVRVYQAGRGGGALTIPAPIPERP
jgi:alpha-1,6-mannosyltransferase